MNSSILQWSEKVNPTSAVRDALGLWNHLNIQIQFTPGITSVTDRIRYYTNLAWYFEHLSKKVITRDFERIFILKCLAHHNGNSKSPELENVFNKTIFDGEWNHKKSFDIDFPIQGFGRSYYVSQLAILKTAWMDFAGNVVLSPINKRLASSLRGLNETDFLQKEYSKEFLQKNLEGFCICDSEGNQNEIDIMSKLLFGFFSFQDDEWDIDDQLYDDFLNGKIDLDFEKKKQQIDELDVENISETNIMNLRRRNTLFLFLKIINETQPNNSPRELRRTMWDATYFSQNRKNKNYIDFGRLERIRVYWEFFQLNVYYVYTLEMILNAIQLIVRKNPGIKKENMSATLDKNFFYSTIESFVNVPPNLLTINELYDKVWKINKKERTDLSSAINESSLYDSISDAIEPEEILGLGILMLCLLRKRYEKTEYVIRDFDKQVRESGLFENKLAIERVLNELLEVHGEKSILEYILFLADKIVEKHLLESSLRMSWGTTNWIFLEEEGALYPARAKNVYFDARDNRWTSIFHLLRDTKFLVDDDPIQLTNKGKKWLSMIG